MNNDEQYTGIIKHPYITRQSKQLLLLNHTTADSANTFMILLNIAEDLCTCSKERFERLLPAFKECYSLIGDADKEIEFIKEQRKGTGDRI